MSRRYEQRTHWTKGDQTASIVVEKKDLQKKEIEAFILSFNTRTNQRGMLVRYVNIGVNEKEDEENDEEKKEKKKEESKGKKLQKKTSIVDQFEISDTFKASSNVRFSQCLTKTINENGEVKLYGTKEHFGQGIFDLQTETIEEIRKNKTKYICRNEDEFHGDTTKNWKF